MADATRHMTADELLQYSCEPYRTELVRGILRRTELSAGQHGEIAMRVAILLSVHVGARALGQVYAAGTGFVLARDPDTVRAPDVAFIARERDEALGSPTGYIPGAPDLAIEVLSPSERPAAVAEKTADWLRAGALAVVELDLATHTARMHRIGAPAETLSGNARLDVGTVVPGWSPRIKELFF